MASSVTAKSNSKNATTGNLSVILLRNPDFPFIISRVQSTPTFPSMLLRVQLSELHFHVNFREQIVNCSRQPCGIGRARSIGTENHGYSGNRSKQGQPAAAFTRAPVYYFAATRTHPRSDAHQRRDDNEETRDAVPDVCGEERLTGHVSAYVSLGFHAPDVENFPRMNYWTASRCRIFPRYTDTMKFMCARARKFSPLEKSLAIYRVTRKLP